MVKYIDQKQNHKIIQYFGFKFSENFNKESEKFNKIKLCYDLVLLNIWTMQIRIFIKSIKLSSTKLSTMFQPILQLLWTLAINPKEPLIESISLTS